MPCSQKEVEKLLQQLENALKETARWSTIKPSNQALSSQVPFACDSMAFEQWLQFIFIPKLQEYMASNRPFSAVMGLHAMGQECFLDLKSQTLLLPILAKIDHYFKE